MVSWIRFYYDSVNGHDIDVWYNVSVNGETFGTAKRIPRDYEHEQWTFDGGDPMVAFSRTSGIGWVGGLDSYQQFFWVCRKDPGDPEAQQADLANFPGQGVDKGLLVVGPQFGGGTADYGLSLVFSRTFGNERRECASCGAVSLKRLRGITSRDFGETWIEGNQFAAGPDLAPLTFCNPQNPQVQRGNRGGCGTPLILHSTDPAYSGRWVVGYSPDAERIYPGCQDPDPPLPRATWTNDGTNWFNSVGPTSARVPGSTSVEPISGFIISAAGAPVVKAPRFPSMAADPRHENDVYMVFSAQAPSSGPNNTDLFIAHSDDGGATFAGAEVLHLTDVQLGDTPGTHQIMPATTVDEFGGVNIVYHTVFNDIDPLYRIYRAKYVRVEVFATNPPPAIVGFPLAGIFYLSGAETGLQPLESNHIFMGDYGMGDSRGCDVYVNFPSLHEPLDSLGNHVGVSVYVSKISVCPPADANSDGAINTADATLYAQYYLEARPCADLNRDTQVNPADFSRFLESYACACTPP